MPAGIAGRSHRSSRNHLPSSLFTVWRATDVGAGLAAAAPEQVREVRTGDRRETVRIRRVTREFFGVLGVDAAVGRTLSQSAGENLAVLSHRVFQGMFDGRRDAIGTSIWIGDAPYVVVGVMPPQFWFSTMDSPIWTLLDADAARGEN